MPKKISPDEAARVNHTNNLMILAALIAKAPANDIYSGQPVIPAGMKMDDPKFNQGQNGKIYVVHQNGRVIEL